MQIMRWPISLTCLSQSCQICHFRKIAICRDAPFRHLICHWPKPGFASLSPHFRFCQAFDGFLPIQFPTFSNLSFFFLNLPTVDMLLFLPHLIFLPNLWWILAKSTDYANRVIFVKPTIIDCLFAEAKKVLLNIISVNKRKKPSLFSLSSFNTVVNVYGDSQNKFRPSISSVDGHSIQSNRHFT